MRSTKNILVIAGLAVILLASCNKPQGQETAFVPVPDLNSPIEFSEQVAEPAQMAATSAAQPTDGAFSAQPEAPLTKGLDPYPNRILDYRFGIYSWWNPIGEVFDELHNPANIYQVNNDVQYVEDLGGGVRKWKCKNGDYGAYWPFKCNLSFFAYAPYLHHEPYEQGGQTLPPDIIFPSADYIMGTPRATYSPRTSVTNQVDFCIAKPVFDRLPSNEPIHFVFQHALTRIQLHVKALGTPMPGTTYRVTDAIISGIAGSNTFTYVNDVDHPFVWDDVTVSNPLDGEYHLTRASTELVPTPLNNASPSAFDTDYLHLNGWDAGRLYLLPQTLTASAYLELAVSAYQGDNLVSIFPPFRMTLPASQPWVEGQTIAYMVTIDISNVTVAGIKAMVIDWDDIHNVHEDEIIY